MTTTLPTNRRRRHLLLTRDDAWALREVVKPWGVPSADGRPTEKMQYLVWEFCTRLYESLLHIEVEGRGHWNMEVSAEDCFVVNQFVKSGMWPGSDGILVQTWMALHEIAEDDGRVVHLELPAVKIAFEVWEVRDAVLEQGEEGSVAARKAPRDIGGIELPPDPNGAEVPKAEGLEL